MKSILVIDTPNACADCKLRRGLFCGENGNSLYDYVNINLKPSWCPLKPLPEKMIPVYHHQFGVDVENEYAKGWNTCLEEIEK